MKRYEYKAVRNGGARLSGAAACLLMLWTATANAQWTNFAANGTWNSVWTPATSPDGIDNTIYSSNPGGTRTVTLDGDHLIGNIAFTINNNRTYIFNSGTPSTSALTLQVSSGTPSVSVAAGATAGFLIINAPIAGNQGLTKSGIGTVVLGGANTYTGPTTLSLGNLVVNGSLASGSPVVVDNVGTQPGLGGAGTIFDGVTLNSGGRISPGNIVLSGTAPSPQVGTLTAGSLTWNGGGTMTFQLGDPSSAANSDQLTLSGALTRGTAGTYDFSFNQLAGFSTAGTYTLINFGSSSGFGAGDFGGAPLDMEFNLTGTSLLLQPIPEPATWAMLLGGFGVLLAFRRRR